MDITEDVVAEITELTDDTIPSETIDIEPVEESEPSLLMEVDEEVPKENAVEILEIPEAEAEKVNEDRVVDEIVPDAIIEPEVADKINKEAEIVENADMTNSSEIEKKIEPDTEAVSEDELPTEAATKVSFNCNFFLN